MFRVVFVFCLKSSTVGLALDLVGSWVVLGFSVGVEVFDELLSINVPWSQEFSGVLRFEFKPPASGFQSYFYSSLKTSPSIQHC